MDEVIRGSGGCAEALDRDIGLVVLSTKTACRARGDDGVVWRVNVGVKDTACATFLDPKVSDLMESSKRSVGSRVEDYILCFDFHSRRLNSLQPDGTVNLLALYHTPNPNTGILRRCMDDLLRDLSLSGGLAESVPRFLIAHGCAHTAEHVRAVAAVSVRLAERFHVDPVQAAAGGWLHDISAVIPVASRVAFAERHGIAVLPEEARVPMILHQKLSVVLARDLFGMEDPAVLSAIGCHTTLCRDATPLDKVVFLADKIAWDQSGTPPYLDALNRALDVSLDAGACVYLHTLWQRRQTLPVVHPWLAEAYAQLCACARSAAGSLTTCD